MLLKLGRYLTDIYMFIYKERSKKKKNWLKRASV